MRRWFQWFSVIKKNYTLTLYPTGHKAVNSHWVPPSQGQVCGLCGNYDGNSKNDFATRSQETVADVLEFGNSWRVSSSCPNAQLISDPCASNRYRAAWSQKQCSIITSVTFQSCHSQVTMMVTSILTLIDDTFWHGKLFLSSFVSLLACQMVRYLELFFTVMY